MDLSKSEGAAAFRLLRLLTNPTILVGFAFGFLDSSFCPWEGLDLVIAA